ncbi:glycine betaine transporter [Thermoactinomyces sp. DSM 45891]|uniref:glycine betaine uptake BCCT transporter n=1 Tax=Thermoactinomyces sp. DSM 45891 TaxID=1761907 RepID=UPI000916D33E|nr:BCCT family transporter [Thermoactinomyces sp. DSM 45891]SFX11870.1 glycine betaine transporter [Thermoactinomyces sp. DSM 45891]
MKKFTTVFMVSVTIAFLFILWGAFYPVHLTTYTSAIQKYLQEDFGWFYLLSATLFLVFSFYLIFSPYGKIKLGKDTDQPEYSTLSWFAMLFSAGMGIGLVFWGVAEPLSHYHNPVVGDPQTAEAGRLAMRSSFFHWGLHPWGIYSVLALALAYFQFRKNAPGLISYIFYPLLKEKVNGPIGKTIDIIAIFATVFGVATSLGFGAVQISAGLSYLTNISNNFTSQLVIIVVVTLLFLVSAATGLSKGIQYLSNSNIILAVLLLLLLLFVGPTKFIMNIFVTTIGNYIQSLPAMSLNMAPFFPKTNEWIQGWTVFYWAWWIAWAPFVGTFIARVSKGRTIREFVIGVLLVPTLFGALWFSVFGGSGLHLELAKDFSLFNIMSDQGTEIALFAMLQQYPMGGILSVLAIFLIATFFITSADSATFVLGMQSSNGSLNPSNYMKVTWGLIISASAAILLFSGGLNALQTASIIVSFPFIFILFGIIFSLVLALRKEKLK